MDIWHSIIMGFSVTLSPVNILFCFIGVLFGTLVGVLPGIGPIAAMSLLLPTTFSLPPVTSLIMLAGIYYGAMYGGSTTSILVNIPGEAASIITCLDGYQMARQGKAGVALGISAFGSFIAGTLSLIGLVFLAPPLGEFALRFGPPEYFSLMFLGLIILSYLFSGSTIKALIMVVFGLMVGSIGMDTISGIPRFTHGVQSLVDGVGLVPVVMGMFGVAEVLANLHEGMKREIFKTQIGSILPNLKDWFESIGAIARGALVGFALGIIPGSGPIISSFASYVVEKKVSRHPERFGQGAIQGVAGPEAANNAAASAGFVPLLSLGIPANPMMALLAGAMIIHGIQPGPTLVSEHPQVFWGVISSMYVGNIMLLFLNLPLIRIWVKVLKIPYSILFPLILIFCLIGVYSVNNDWVEIIIMIIFGLLGFFLKQLGYEPAPFVLALVLGPLMETAFRQSLLLLKGNPQIFLIRPISGILMGAAFITLVLPLFKLARRRLKGA
jgi:putative tricarboxylic transport membrane protein